MLSEKLNRMCNCVYLFHSGLCPCGHLNCWLPPLFGFGPPCCWERASKKTTVDCCYCPCSQRGRISSPWLNPPLLGQMMIQIDRGQHQQSCHHPLSRGRELCSFERWSLSSSNVLFLHLHCPPAQCCLCSINSLFVGSIFTFGISLNMAVSGAMESRIAAWMNPIGYFYVLRNLWFNTSIKSYCFCGWYFWKTIDASHTPMIIALKFLEYFCFKKAAHSSEISTSLIGGAILTPPRILSHLI